MSFEISDINFDHLRRKRAFLKGINIQLDEEFDKDELVGFNALPDLLPVVPKGNIATLDYEQLTSCATSEEEQKAATESTPGTSHFDYDS